jgi:uncharacterized protein (TIGR01777 family)
LSRKQDQFGRVRVFRWDPEKGIIDPLIFEGVDYVVHLSGANIGEKRWNAERKKEIENSRIESSNLLFKTVSENRISLKAFISASAIGYYGSAISDKIFKEDDPPADDFLGSACRRWEEAADQFTDLGTRVVKIRSGVILEKNDSALSKLLIPARLGVFPRLGSGRQYMPWIHIDDLCGIYLKAIQDLKMEGAYNANSPQHIMQKEFMRMLAKVLNRPFLNPQVAAILFRAFLGEMADVVLKGSRISPEKIINSGFSFSFSNLENALKDLLKSEDKILTI